MKTLIEMAREAVMKPSIEFSLSDLNLFKRFEALVRADEREQGQKWFDAVTAQHKQLILAEREACAKVCDVLSNKHGFEGCYADECAATIRARGQA